MDPSSSDVKLNCFDISEDILVKKDIVSMKAYLRRLKTDLLKYHSEFNVDKLFENLKIWATISENKDYINIIKSDESFLEVLELMLDTYNFDHLPSEKLLIVSSLAIKNLVLISTSFKRRLCHLNYLKTILENPKFQEYSTYHHECILNLILHVLDSKENIGQYQHSDIIFDYCTKFLNICEYYDRLSLYVIAHLLKESYVLDISLIRKIYFVFEKNLGNVVTMEYILYGLLCLTFTFGDWPLVVNVRFLFDIIWQSLNPMMHYCDYSFSILKALLQMNDVEYCDTFFSYFNIDILFSVIKSSQNDLFVKCIEVLDLYVNRYPHKGIYIVCFLNDIVDNLKYENKLEFIKLYVKCILMLDEDKYNCIICCKALEAVLSISQCVKNEPLLSDIVRALYKLDTVGIGSALDEINGFERISYMNHDVFNGAFTDLLDKYSR